MVLGWRSSLIDSHDFQAYMLPNSAPQPPELPIAIIAGVICIDIIPDLSAVPGEFFHLLSPSRLVTVGPAVTATGGVVSNTGLALHRLGVPVRLMGKVGDDLFGQSILGLLGKSDTALTRSMIIAPGEASSYSIVINPPDTDRAFLYCTGANDTFRSADVMDDQLQGAGLFHFGYPPVMKHLAFDGGLEMAGLFHRARLASLLTSLDMTMPDPDTPAGQMDWTPWFARVLPQVDFLLPSLDEMRLMMHTQADLHALAGQLLELGAPVVGLKLGDQGLYLRTTPQRDRLPASLDDSFLGRELLAPCFQVNVAGTTGAGDCTNAGFLAALLRGLPVEQVMTNAVATGAYNVEVLDAVSGVPTWAEQQARMQAGWPRRPLQPAMLDYLIKNGWLWDALAQLWLGPADCNR